MPLSSDSVPDSYLFEGCIALANKRVKANKQPKSAYLVAPISQD